MSIISGTVVDVLPCGCVQNPCIMAAIYDKTLERKDYSGAVAKDKLKADTDKKADFEEPNLEMKPRFTAFKCCVSGAECTYRSLSLTCS